MRKSQLVSGIALTGLIGCGLVACGSKKDANKSNFKAAIQAELDKDPVCIAATLPDDTPSWNGQLKTNDQLEPLMQAGLVKRTQRMMARSPMDVEFEDKRPKEVQGYRYEVADNAKKYVQQVRTLGGHSPELCYGKKKVEDIVRYTEPSAAMGMTVSQVTYTWRLVDSADWARNPGIEKQYYTEQFLNAANQPQEAKIGLALSNDGWHVPSAF